MRDFFLKNRRRRYFAPKIAPSPFSRRLSEDRIFLRIDAVDKLCAFFVSARRFDVRRSRRLIPTSAPRNKKAPSVAKTQGAFQNGETPIFQNASVDARTFVQAPSLNAIRRASNARRQSENAPSFERRAIPRRRSPTDDQFQNAINVSRIGCRGELCGDRTFCVRLRERRG